MSAAESFFEHSVQFYERDAFLCDRVSKFLEEGLRAGEPALVIATEAHRSAVEAELQRRGCHSGPITYLDARETLERFMAGVLPDEETFYSVIGQAIEQQRNGGGRIRAYGEMVDLLWRDGNPDAAIRLEELWNRIAGHYDFSLLCAYPMGNFQSESDSTGFDAICARHSHVVPTEAYAGEDGDDARLREVSTLQQRTAALETEIALRKRLDEERRRAEEINAFLAEASATLNRSLDYDSRLREIESLIVPRLADSCSIDVLCDDEEPSVVDAQIAPDGSSMAVPLRLPDRPLGSITLQSDVPGRYANDDLALAVELARRCAVALENARLYRLANEANRTKDEFLATLSHELRTPLTTILGWARMLTLGGLDEQMKRVAYETIERSARTQATLIDDLLDLSRVVTGKLTLQSEPVDLATIVENAMQTQQLAADTKGIAIEVITGSERAIVNGDPTRLQQIVWNLLSNAIKFSEAGAKVSLELERDSEDARIIVRDQGKGISPEFLPHVFEAFRQGDSASTRKHGGLGLGLAIVKYLTELHGGSVSAASPGDGQGATFLVTLPLVRA